MPAETGAGFGYSLYKKKNELKETRNLALCKRGEMELNRRLSTEGIQM